MKKSIKKPLALLLCLALCAVGAQPVGLRAESITGALQMNDTVSVDLGGQYTDAASVLSATVSNHSVNDVKEAIFGANISWIDNGGKLWDADQNAPDATLFNKLKASDVKVLRYPGGIEGDYFHWYETVGDNRVDQINPFSSQYPTYAAKDGETQPVTFGVNEFFSLCEAANVKASVQLNTGNGTPQEAADYVRYMLQSGYIDRVDTLSLGNESCMHEERVAGVYVTKTPAQYIDFCNSFYSLLGSALNGKDVNLGVIGITPSHPLCKYANWDSSVISALRDYIDFIDVHIGYSYYFQSDSTTEETAVKCFLASSKWISSLIQEEKSIIEENGGSRADDISIQISEMGPVGGKYPSSLAGGLFLADLYNTILSEPKVTATDYLPLIGHYASSQLLGSLTDSSVSSTRFYWDNVSTYVYRMYASLIGWDVLKTKTTGGYTFDSAACGLIPAIAGVQSGSVSTYFDPETGKGSLFLINKSLNQNQTFEVSLPFSVQIGVMNELWHSDPTAKNTSGFQRKVYPKRVGTYAGQCGHVLSVKTKPCSLVRVDFTLDDSQRLLWNDDFSGDTIDDYIITGPDNGLWGNWAIQDGKLCVTGNVDARWYGTTALLSRKAFRDFTMEFDADVLSGYGVILRAQDRAGTVGQGLNTWFGGNGYAILHWEPIEDSAEIALYDFNGAQTKIASLGNPAAMQRAHWKIDAQGSDITVTVTDRDNADNQITYTIEDDRYSIGCIGFYNLTFAGVTSLKVDNLSVREKDASVLYSAANAATLSEDFQAVGTWSAIEDRIFAVPENRIGYLYEANHEFSYTDIRFRTLSCSEGVQYGVVMASGDRRGSTDGGDAYTVMYDGNWIFAGKLDGDFTQITQTDSAYAYDPTDWGVIPLDWRITLRDGAIRVYLNGDARPVITVYDSTFQCGYAGLRVFSASGTGRVTFQNVRFYGCALGDMTSDGNVDIADLLFLKAYLNGLEPLENEQALLFSKDVVPGDAAYHKMQAYLLGLSRRLSDR